METINVSVHPNISHIPNGMEQIIERAKNMTSSERDKELKTIKYAQMAVEDAIVRDRRRQSYSHERTSQHYAYGTEPKYKREDMDASSAESINQAVANYRKSQGWDGVPLRQNLRSMNAEIFAEVERELSRKTAQPTNTNQKPQYPIDNYRFTKMAREAYSIVNPILGLGDPIDKYLSLMVEYSMTFDTDFEDYLTSIGVSDKVMSDTFDKYEIYHKGDQDIVFFRMNKYGKTLNGNIITIDKAGRVMGCRRVFSHHSYYDTFWSFGTAYFGGHLLKTHLNWRDPIFIVQDELTALLGAIVYPTRVWLALGMGQNLTDDHLKVLEGQRAIMYPDDMSVEFWTKMASKFHNVETKTTFVDRDINEYFINLIKDANSGLYEARLSGDMEPPIALAKLILFS